MGEHLVEIRHVLEKVDSNETGVYSKTPLPIVVLGGVIADVIGDNLVHISEFVIAKIRGLIPTLNSHPDITDKTFERMIHDISTPQAILVDTRKSGKYLFIVVDSLHVIAIEVKRKESGKTEVNTMYSIDRKEQRRLGKYPVAFGSIPGRTPSFPSYMPHH